MISRIDFFRDEKLDLKHLTIPPFVKGARGIRNRILKHLPYNKNLKQFSRNLRNDSTLAEIILWKELRAGKMMGYKFNRQKPLLNYIVDFYCKPLNLVIEVDGVTHTYEGSEQKDLKRQVELERIGLKFLRFGDSDVKKNMSSVLRAIEEYIEEFEKRKSIPPTPFPRGSGEERPK